MLLKFFVTSVALTSTGTSFPVVREIVLIEMYTNILMLEFNQGWTNGLFTNECTYLAFSINL